MHYMLGADISSTSLPVEASPIDAQPLLVPPETNANFSPIESLDTYRFLVKKDTSFEMGSFEQWVGGKKQYKVHEAAQRMATPECGRQTAWDDTCISLKGFDAAPMSLWVTYTFMRNSYEYKNANTYMNTLELEYDYRTFLSLLKLHRVAGVELLSSYYPITPSSTYIKPLRSIGTILNTRAQGNPGWSSLPCMIIQPFYPLDSKWKEKDHSGTWGLSPLMWMDDLRYRELWTKGAVVNLAAGNPNQVDFAALDRVKSVGFIDGEILRQAFISQVLRFRERMIAHGLFLTTRMLDTAQLEDADTLVKLINYFASTAEDPARQIDTPEYIDILNPDRTVAQAKIEVRFSDLVINVGTKTKQLWRTVPQLLMMQWEAAMWLFIANQPKYSGRIAQLLNPNAVLQENNVRPFQTDPWKNPFLVFDEAASRAANKPVYRDTAAALASKGSRPATQVSEFVDLTSMQEGMSMWDKFRRREVAPLTYKSPFETQPPKQTNAVWVLAALAAAGALITMR